MEGRRCEGTTGRNWRNDRWSAESRGPGSAPRMQARLTGRAALTMSLDEVIQKQSGNDNESVKRMSWDETRFPRRSATTQRSAGVRRTSPAARRTSPVARSRSPVPLRSPVDIKPAAESSSVGRGEAKCQTRRGYKEDAFKSLDEVIIERKISHPFSSRSKFHSSPSKNSQRDGVRNEIKWSPPRQSTFKADKIDPMASSLDNVIVARNIGEDEFNRPSGGGRNGSGLSAKERMRREFEKAVLADASEDEAAKPNVPSDGHHVVFSKRVMTPYEVICFYNEIGMNIDMKVGTKVEKGDPDRAWRCHVKSGNAEGVAESGNEWLAKEAAAERFLVVLRQAYPNGLIPYYEPASGDLSLDPSVYEGIEKLRRPYQHFYYEFPNVKKDKDAPRFTCRYSFGSKRFHGVGNSRISARLNAAYKMYEHLSSGMAYPKLVHFAGDDCDLTVEYSFGPSEVYPKLTLEKGDDIGIEIPRSKLTAFGLDEPEEWSD